MISSRSDGFTPPAGFQFTDPNQGGDDALDSDADPTTGLTQTVTLTSGGTFSFTGNDIEYNGKVYHAAALKTACYRCHIKLLHRPPGDPAPGGLIERFFRTDKSRSREMGGTGLGRMCLFQLGDVPPCFQGSATAVEHPHLHAQMGRQGGLVPGAGRQQGALAAPVGPGDPQPAARLQGQAGTNWKTDLSGGIQRVAIKHGCSPFGNAKARAVVWTFPDPVPVHREPLYTTRRDLVEKYPTYEDRKTFYRLPTRYESIQAKDYTAEYPLIMTSGRLVEYEGGGDETRSNPWLWPPIDCGGPNVPVPSRFSHQKTPGSTISAAITSRSSSPSKSSSATPPPIISGK